MMLWWKGGKPKSKHDWPAKDNRTPEEPDFQQALDEHREYVLYPQKTLLQPSGHVVKKQKKVKFRDLHDLALRQPVVDPDLFQPYGLFQPLKAHDWVGKDLMLRQGQVDRWLADHTEFTKRTDQPPPDKNHDFPVIGKLHSTLKTNDEQRPLPVETREHVTKQKASIQQARTYQWELEVAWAKLWVADAMCPTMLPDEEEPHDEYVHNKDMDFHDMNIKGCLKEIAQVKADIKREETHLMFLNADIFDKEEISWARSKHWEIPEDMRITPVSILHLLVEHWERQAEQARERDQAAQAATEAASMGGKFQAALQAINAAITGDAVMSAFGGVRPSRRNNVRKNASSKAPIDPTPQTTTTSATTTPETGSATLSTPASHSSPPLSWHSSMATLPSSPVSSTSPAPIPRTEEELPPAKSPTPQGSQPIEINIPNRMKQGRQHMQDTPMPQGTQPMDINLPNRVQRGREPLRRPPPDPVPQHPAPQETTQARGQLPRRGKFKKIYPPLEFGRITVRPLHEQPAGPSLLSKSLAVKKSAFVTDDNDDGSECAIIDEEEEGAQVEDKIDELDKDEKDDENKENEPEDATEQDGDDDSVHGSDDGSIPENMTRGQILRRPGDPSEEEPKDEDYEGDVDSGEDSGVKLDEEEQETDDTDDSNDNLEGRPNTSRSSSMVCEVDSDSAWETVPEGDTDKEEDASDEEASNDEQEAE